MKEFGVVANRNLALIHICAIRNKIRVVIVIDVFLFILSVSKPELAILMMRNILTGQEYGLSVAEK